MGRDLEWRSVESSNIAAVAQDGEALYVRFHNGSIYKYSADAILACYDDTTNAASAESLHLALVEADENPAESVGSTFHRLVKPIASEKLEQE